MSEVVFRPRQSMPSGIVTFLFTDIEGSTRRWEQHPQEMQAALTRHDEILREAIEAKGGYVFKTVGDAFCAAFLTPHDALAAALSAQRALTGEQWDETTGPIRVRMALHTGFTEERGGDYFGQPVNRVARLLSAGHGGQTLLSLSTQELVKDLLPAGVELLDFGEHRLKDLERPERIFQVFVPDLPSKFPLLKTLDARFNNLPVQPTPLIGREKELAAVCALLRPSQTGVGGEGLGERDSRQPLTPNPSPPGPALVTLTGPGGTGKTRLGLQVAANLIDEFDDGAIFVNLAPISDPNLVATTIAQALGVRQSPGQSLMESLKDYLRKKQMLLFLDNFEQVARAAPLVAELLSASRTTSDSAHGLSVLVTSRTRLQLRGEREFQVPPLQLPEWGSGIGDRGSGSPAGRSPVPDPRSLLEYEAVRLFVERATSLKPDFQVTNDNAQAVAEICHRLDGLPLAIELAAARIKVLPLNAMLARLQNRLKLLTGGAQDLPTRHQTLQATIDWSYDLLTEPERELFGRLSVFAGGWTLEAVEAVCAGDEVDEYEVLDLLAQLVDKSLALFEEHERDEARYRMLETIREYARTRLTDTSVYDRMVDYFTSYVESNPTDYDALDLETPNVLTALQAAHDRGLSDNLIRGTNAFYHHLETRGSYGLAEDLLRRAEQAARSGGDNLGLATALLNLGRVAERHGDYAKAESRYQEGLALARAMEHQERCSALLQNLGAICIRRGDYGRAETYLSEGLALAREIGHRERMSALLGNLGTVAINQGDCNQAETYYKESLDLARAVGNRERISALLQGLGVALGYRGDHDGAEAYYLEALALAREIGHRERISHILMNLGAVGNSRGDYQQAETYLLEGLALAREIDNRERVSDLLQNLGIAARSRGDYEQAEAYLLEGLELARALDHRERISFLLGDLGAVACSRGEYAQAEVYFQEGLEIARTIGHQFIISNILSHWGELHLRRQHAELAAATFAESLAIGHEVGSHDLAATALYGLARTVEAQGDLNSARRQGTESLEIFDSIGHRKAEEVRKWLDTL